MEFTRKAQNLKKGLPHFGHRVREYGRRMFAVLLCASMVLSGFPGSFFQAFASDDSEEFYYELEKESLYEAVCTAVSEGTTVDKELDFTGEFADRYAELFDADGTLYELKDLEVQKDRDRDKALELRAFVRVEGDILLDGYYEAGGDETVIFLLINKSKDAASAVIYIDDLETETIEVISAAAVSRDGGPGSKSTAEAVSGSAGSGSGASANGASKISAEGENELTEATEDEAETKEEAEDDSETFNDDKSENVSTEADADAGQEDGESSDSDVEAESSDTSSDAKDVGDGDSENSDDSAYDSSDSSSDDNDSSDTRDNSEGRDHSDRGDSTDRNDNSDRGDRSDQSDNDHSDRESSSSDRDFSGGRSTSDSEKTSGSGSSSTGSGDESGSDGSDKTASVSSNNVGILSAAIAEEEEEADDEAGDIVITIDDGADSIVITTDSDIIITSDSEVIIASASDADEEDSSNNDTTAGNMIDGEIYDAVILDAKKAAVAFVTSAEDLGLDKYSHLEDQTIDAKIYEDDSYGFRLADGTSITLTGMMPVDAEVKAYPVEVEIEDVNILAAYDITIFDKHGKEFQPEEDDSIEVLIENAAIYEALDDEHELTIYHMEDEFDEPEEIATIEPAPRRLQALSFLADRFSIYVVGDGTLTDDNNDSFDVYTVNFYEYVYDEGRDFNDQDKLVSTQRVWKPDETDPAETPNPLGEDEDGYLTEPSVPEVDHHVFDGWYTTKQDTYHEDHDELPGCKFDFSKTVQQNLDTWEEEGNPYKFTENYIINLYTDYDPIYYVYFMSSEEEYDEDNNPVESFDIFTAEYHENNTILDTTTAESFYQTSLGADKAVTDWYYYDENGNRQSINEAKESAPDGEFHVTDNLILYAEVSEVIWIYYVMGEDEDEAEKIGKEELNVEALDPTYVLSSAKSIGELGEAVRPGYTFEGWYTYEMIDDEQIEIKVTSDLDPNNLIGDNGWITLYAHWTPAPVGYTVNIWRQKATDGATGVNQKVVQNGESYENYIGYYDFAESIHIDATTNGLKTGDTPTANTVSGWSTYTGYGNIRDINSAYYGFEYNQTRTLNNLATIEMASDGSTIINIFYDRVTITWTFRTGSGTSSNKTLIGLYGTNCAQGNDPAGDLSDWPNPSDFGSNYNRWEHNSTNMTFETTFVILDSSTSVTFTRNTVNSGGNGYYYLEITNENQLNSEKEAEAQSLGIPYTRQVNNTWYRYERYITRSTGDFTITDKYTGYEVTGYTTVRRGNTDSSTTYTGASEGGSIPAEDGNIFNRYYLDFYLFHNAREYTITLESTGVNIGFDTNGEPEDGGSNPTYTFKYGQDLTSIQFPEELDAEIFGPNYYYFFTGKWYEDPDCSEQFEIPASMPAYNLVAYADWELNQVEVTFNSYVDCNLYDVLKKIYGEENITVISNGDPDANDNQLWSYTIIITAGDMLDYDLDDGLLSKVDDHDYEYAGWLNVENDKIFNFESHIYTDTTLQVFWIEEETPYYLEYDINLEDYTGDNPILGHAHSSTSYAEVRELTDVFEDASDDYFLYWYYEVEDGDGNVIDKIIYYPGDHVDFTQVTSEPVYVEDESGGLVVDYYVYKLHAAYAEKNEVALILDYNYPNGYTGEDGNPQATGNQEPSHPQTDIIGESLSNVKLEERSELAKTVITVDDTTFWFIGWSEDENWDWDSGSNILISVNATVAVTENESEEGEDPKPNILYAIWEPVKKVSQVDDSNYEDGMAVTVGDEITYTITYVNNTDDVAEIIITDTLDDALDFIEASDDGTYNEQTRIVTWVISNVEPGMAASVSLKVKVNANASEESVGNTAIVSVGNEEITGTVTIPVGQNTYGIDIYKYAGDGDDQTPLEGAKFILSRAVESNGDNDKPVETVEYGVFTTERVSEGENEPQNTVIYTFTEWNDDINHATELISAEDGFIHLANIDPGTYTLTEIKAPDGYVLLTESIEFTLNSDGTVTITAGTDVATVDEDEGTIHIINEAGFELPSTGGSGTLPFRALGAFLTGSSLWLLFLTLRRKRRWVKS